MNFPIHDFPYDYWRFTPEGFRSILELFTSSFLDFTGNDNFPHTIVGIGFKNSMSENAMDELIRRFKQWKTFWRNPSESRWRKLVKPFVPPIFFSLLKINMYYR